VSKTRRAGERTVSGYQHLNSVNGGTSHFGVSESQ
jgi:hypothetical protein